MASNKMFGVFLLDDINGDPVELCMTFKFVSQAVAWIQLHDESCAYAIYYMSEL